jgi:hypothetical protein
MEEVYVVSVQRWLGHSSIAMTMRYAHLAPGAGDAIEVLDRNPRCSGSGQKTDKYLNLQTKLRPQRDLKKKNRRNGAALAQSTQAKSITCKAHPQQSPLELLPTVVTVVASSTPDPL